MTYLVRNLSFTLAAAAALSVAAPGAALAHECMISNQSQQGSISIGHSPRWLSENMATTDAYLFTFEVVLGVEPTEQMLQDAVAMHVQQGLQEWTAFFQGHTLLGVAMIDIAQSLLETT